MKPISTISSSSKLGLCVFGIWPCTPYSVCYRFLWAVSMIMFQVSQYRYIISHFSTDDFSDFVDNLSTAMSYTLVSSKLIIVWINRSVFYDIVSSMAKDWDKSVIVDPNVMIRTSYRSHYFLNVIIGLHPVAVLLYAAGVFASSDQNREYNETSRRLLFKMDLPFESSASPIYELVVITQFVHQLFSATISGILGILPLAMVLHVGAQIEIMCRRFKDVSSVDNDEMKFFVDWHQEIIDFTANVEKLFTYMALVQFTSNIVIICCLGVLIMISVGQEGGTPTLVKCVLFYVVIALEAFLLCFAGEYLSSKSKMIGNAAYECHWYNLYPTKSRPLVLLMLRSQKDLTMSVGKFMNLSLECFTALVRASASYASVLLALY